MTADEKIEESEYHLKNMKDMGGWKKEFNYEFNSFVASSRSILDHLLDDYTTKFNLQIPLETRELRSEFQKKSKGKQQAEEFWKWYQQEYDKIVNEPIIGSLLKKRNIVLHRKTITAKKYVIGVKFPEPLVISSPAGTATNASFPLTGDIDNIAKIEIVTTDLKTGEKKTKTIEQKPTIDMYLEDDHDQTIDVVCEVLLNRIKKMVKDAQTRFP